MAAAGRSVSPGANEAVPNELTETRIERPRGSEASAVAAMRGSSTWTFHQDSTHLNELSSKRRASVAQVEDGLPRAQQVAKKTSVVYVVKRQSVARPSRMSTGRPTRFSPSTRPTQPTKPTGFSPEVAQPAAAAVKDEKEELKDQKENLPNNVRENSAVTFVNEKVNFPPTTIEDDTESEGSTDLNGLLQYLEDMRERHSRFLEVTYVVNCWLLGGVIPLKHHGFILRREDDSYLTLDFTRRGILWETFSEFPGLPDGTMYAQTHPCSVDPAQVKFYCHTTKPFSWPGNDCSHWARGLLQIMMVLEDPHGYHGEYPATSNLNSVSCIGSKGFNPLSVVRCFS